MSSRLFGCLTLWSVIGLHSSGAAERSTINGKVVDPEGNPVDHATVLVYKAHTRHGYSVYCPTCWADCGKRTISNAEGNYSIPGLNPDLVFKLLIVKPGHKTVFVDKVDPSKGSAPNAFLKSAALASGPSQTVRGRVVDDHGNPLRDVVVEQQGITFNGPHGRGRSFGPDDSRTGFNHWRRRTKRESLRLPMPNLPPKLR